MKKQTISLGYSIGLSFIVIYVAFSEWEATLLDEYPLFQNAYIYGLSADYSRLIGMVMLEFTSLSNKFRGVVQL